MQPDVSHAGGIIELRKIAAVAETHHIPLCPHNPSGPVANAATLQLAASLPGFFLLQQKCIKTVAGFYEPGQYMMQIADNLDIYND